MVRSNTPPVLLPLLFNDSIRSINRHCRHHLLRTQSFYLFCWQLALIWTEIIIAGPPSASPAECVLVAPFDSTRLSLPFLLFEKMQWNMHDLSQLRQIRRGFFAEFMNRVWSRAYLTADGRYYTKFCYFPRLCVFPNSVEFNKWNILPWFSLENRNHFFFPIITD